MRNAALSVVALLLAVLTFYGFWVWLTWAMQASTWGWISALGISSSLVFTGVYLNERYR